MSVSLSPVAASVTTTADETYKVLSFDPQDTTKYKKFPLYFLGSSDMDLYLKGGSGGEFVQFSGGNVAGHFDANDILRLQKNLRVGFLTYSTAYQTGEGAVYSEYPIDISIYATEETNNTYTTFTELGYSQTDRDTKLASTKKNEVTMIEVVIWLEEDGLGALEAICELSLSLRFEAVPVSN